MARAPLGPPFGGSPRAFPITPPGQSPGLGLRPPTIPRTEGVPGAPPSGSFTPSRQPPGLLLRAAASPTLQHPNFRSPSSATPTWQPRRPPPAPSAPTYIDGLRVQPPKEDAAPAAPTMTGSSQQQQLQQQDGAGTRATVRGEPSETAKEYVSAVKAYEQQVGPNIVRGKMYIESLPAYAVPPEQRFSTVAPEMAPGMAPGPGCGYNIAMGVGPGQPSGYGRGMPMAGSYDAGRPMDGGYEDAGRPMSGRNGQPIAAERRFSGTSLAAQLSRERFKEFAEMDTALKFVELAQTWPQTKRLMDMGGRLDEIINVPRNYEVPSGSAYAGPPIWRRGSFERSMNVPGGFGRQPIPGYDRPMRLPPDYGGRIDRYDRTPDRYDRSGDRYDPSPDRYDAPPPNAGYYGGRAYFGENSKRVREDYEQRGRAASNQPSQKRASDLLRKIWEDIDEHCAERMFPQIYGEVAGYETGEKEERTVRGGNLPENRTKSQQNFREDDGVSRKAWRTSSPNRRFPDDYDVPKGSSSPRRHPSRRRKESSSSSSSSSDRKSRRSRIPRRCKDDSTKSFKSRSKRRSKSKTKRSSSSSNSSSSRSRRLGKGKSAKKKSSSSSSSSSSDGRRGNKKGKGVEFERSVTGRMSSEAQKEQENIRKRVEAVVESLSSRRGGNGCPFLNMLGIRPREQEGLQRPQTRNAAEALPTYGVEERQRSRNFGGEIVAYNGVPRPVSRNLGGASVANSGVSTPTLRNFSPEVEGFDGDVQSPPSRSFGGTEQRMSFRGCVYRYESQPSAFKRD